MQSIPENVAAYRRTPEFDEDSVPDVWLSPHSTKRGVWAKIIVLEGRLLYTIRDDPREEVYLDADHFGVVAPRTSHMVKPVGKVRFYIEFYR